MPTGYTADVADGKVTDFAKFAMQCARAFGALVSMRDEPSDAAIPETFEPCDYHVNALRDARAELARLKGMTIDEQEAACRKASQEAQDFWDRYEAEKVAKRKRYEAMLARVEAWEPPTSEHVPMKEFMSKQLRESIDFDCGPAYCARPEPKKRSEWYVKEIEEAASNVARHEAEHAKEVERARGRTEWVRALRSSLATT